MTGPDMIQRRGGLTPGSAPQLACDVCRCTLDPDEAVELTLTRPAPPGATGSVTVRVYGHPQCALALPVLAGFQKALAP